MTKPNPFRYFNSSPEIIRLAVMMYVRFPLSLRNVEDLLHERGIDISHETIRYWWNRFGPLFAADIKRKRIQSLRAHSNWKWHLDEVFVKINGETHDLWRAVDHEGEVLDSVVTKRRDKRAALKLLRKLLRSYGEPETIVTDKLKSYGAALRELGVTGHETSGRWINNRAENSHPLPSNGLLTNHEKEPFRRRERAMQRFRLMRSLQKFASIHSSIYNHFNQERSLYSRHNFKENRTAALQEWRQLCAA